MNEPESLCLTFGEASRERGPVTCVARGLYRLGWSPFVAAAADVEVSLSEPNSDRTGVSVCRAARRSSLSENRSESLQLLRTHGSLAPQGGMP